MGRPRMTDEQRAVAVALLANAIRKEEHLRVRQRGRSGDDLALAAGTRVRADASSQYLRGMRDLLAVLFAGGRAVADECFEAARAEALDERPAR